MPAYTSHLKAETFFLYLRTAKLLRSNADVLTSFVRRWTTVLTNLMMLKTFGVYS